MNMCFVNIYVNVLINLLVHVESKRVSCAVVCVCGNIEFENGKYNIYRVELAILCFIRTGKLNEGLYTL